MLLVTGLAVAASGTVGCSRDGTGGAASAPGRSAPAGSASSGPATFADVDASMQARSADDELPAVVTVVRGDGSVAFDRTYGGADPTARIRIASASKWLTAALVMTFVDAGDLALDDPVSRWLPAFATEDKATITMRQLLSHTSGIGSNGCIWERATTMAACVDEIAGDPLIDRPGERFHYGNTSFQVAARVVEVIGDRPFSELFQERVAAPLGFTATRFDEGEPTANPTPAASGESSAADYLRFVAMLFHRGTVDGRPFLRPESVAELLHDQTVGHQNEADGAVQITGVPRYGLGCWLDRTDGAHDALLASGSGSLGAYPFVDREHDAYGVVWVEDGAHSDGTAVQRSQALTVLIGRALAG